MNVVFAGTTLCVAGGRVDQWVVGSDLLGGPVAQSMLWLGILVLAMASGALVSWLPTMLPLRRGPVRELLGRRA